MTRIYSFHRVTRVGRAGRYSISTVGLTANETMIFDNEDDNTGRAWYCEHHKGSDDLNKCHEDVVRRFLAGEIVLDSWA